MGPREVRPGAVSLPIPRKVSPTIPQSVTGRWVQPRKVSPLRAILLRKVSPDIPPSVTACRPGLPQSVTEGEGGTPRSVTGNPAKCHRTFSTIPPSVTGGEDSSRTPHSVSGREASRPFRDRAAASLEEICRAEGVSCVLPFAAAVRSPCARPDERATKSPSSALPLHKVSPDRAATAVAREAAPPLAGRLRGLPDSCSPSGQR